MAERNETRGRERTRDRDEDEDRGSRRGRDRDDDRGSRGSSRDRDRDDDRGGRSSGRSSGYRYQARDEGEAKRRAEHGANEFDRVLKPHIKVWKPKDRVNRIRIVPPTWDNAKHFGVDVHVHYGVGPDRATYLCLNKMKGEADPIAEEHAEAVREGDDDYAKELSAKHRVLIYLVDRDDEKEGVQAWMMPSGLDRDIVKISHDRSSGEVLLIDHPEEGYDVTFEKNGTGKTTKYEGVAIARRSSPLGKAAWLDFAVENPLPDQLQYYDYDHIAKVFNGKGQHRGDRDRDDDDRGSRGRDRDDDRGRDRDDDRGSRDRGRDRDDDDRGSRGRDREESTSRRRNEIAYEDRPDVGRDVEPSGRRGQSSAPTWESIHEMTGQELEDLIDQENLKINPNDAKSDDELADWICEDLKIVKSQDRRRNVSRDESEDESPSERMRRMRQNRD